LLDHFVDDGDDEQSSALNALARFAGRNTIESKSLPAKELKFSLLRDPTIGHQKVKILIFIKIF
jgi:hypothetical protein